MGEETGMAAAGDDSAVDDASVQALKDLVDRISEGMLEAAKGEVLTARGVMFAAAVALRGFTLIAQQVEGWTEEQAKAYAQEALNDAFTGEISVDHVTVAMADSGAPRH